MALTTSMQFILSWPVQSSQQPIPSISSLQKCTMKMFLSSVGSGNFHTAQKRRVLGAHRHRLQWMSRTFSNDSCYTQQMHYILMYILIEQKKGKREYSAYFCIAFPCAQQCYEWGANMPICNAKQ